ncbi:MAG: DUF1273 domain-containing protein [Defluviitaleaceae bacterium]|nr:DUF1273 domain-containing protein [Defluviitaleaceae bacterium]
MDIINGVNNINIDKDRSVRFGNRSPEKFSFPLDIATITKKRPFVASPVTNERIAQVTQGKVFTYSFDATGGMGFELKINNEYIKLCICIDAAIINATKRGYHTFLCNMTRGFDLLCAQSVLEFRKDEKYSHLQLIAVQPYINYSFTDKWGDIHQEVMNTTNHVVLLNKACTNECYYLRNEFMINNSSHLICYCNEQESGKSRTIIMAEECGHSIDNLYKQWSDLL